MLLQLQLILIIKDFMRKDQIDILDSIQKLTVNQFYLLQTPKTPQQQFLHLFGQRVLIKKSMFNKNLDKIKTKLQGTLANTSLNTALIALYIDNRVQFQEQSSLFELLQGWVNFYPTIKTKNRPQYLLKDLILQDSLQLDSINGFHNFLAYVNLISLDVWKVIRNKKDQKQFFAPKPIKEELKQIISQQIGSRLDANDLLAFVSGCIPKILLNIILEQDGLPAQIKKNVKKLQCLYSNQATQYFLKTNTKLSLILRQVLVILLSMDLNAVQQKFLMLIVLRYYYAFSFDRKYSAPQIFIHAFNKLKDEVRKSLNDEFALFFKIILKLGKEKFSKFIEDNSAFGKNVVGMVRKKPLIGYPQQSANPYNTAGISQVINIERGAKASKAFEVLQDFSIFYFRIQIEALDITVRLYYLGDIQGQKQVKTLLFTHEKVVGQLKNSVNAMKKGLYLFQFDNSYSWINGKKIFYQNVIYSPLELKAANAYQWIQDFYEGTPLNEIANDQDILVLQYKKAEPKENIAGRAFIQRQQGKFQLRIKKSQSQYTYEVDNNERMLQKVNEFINSKEKYQWHINNNVVQDLGQIQNYIRGVQSSNQTGKQTKVIKKEEKKASVQKIGIQQYRDDDQQEVEYEVAQRQVDKSQIINESSRLPSTAVETSKKEEKQKKQIIAYSQQEQNEAYNS